MFLRNTNCDLLSLEVQTLSAGAILAATLPEKVRIEMKYIQYISCVKIGIIITQ